MISALHRWMAVSVTVTCHPGINLIQDQIEYNNICYQVWTFLFSETIPNLLIFLISSSSQWPSSLLGHEEPSASFDHHLPVGAELRLCVQQGQPQPPLQYVWIWVSHPPQVSNHIGGIHPQGWDLELAEWGEGEAKVLFIYSGLSKVFMIFHVVKKRVLLLRTLLTKWNLSTFFISKFMYISTFYKPFKVIRGLWPPPQHTLCMIKKMFKNCGNQTRLQDLGAWDSQRWSSGREKASLIFHDFVC